jgi:hypothetical protein
MMDVEYEPCPSCQKRMAQVLFTLGGKQAVVTFCPSCDDIMAIVENFKKMLEIGEGMTNGTK